MSLEIFVINAINLPNLESLGKIDPYLSAVFQGTSKKTEVVKSELNPTWNQNLVFDLKGQSVQEKDEIKLLVKDWERVGRNRLVGSATVLMRDVIRTEGGAGAAAKLSLSLTDSNQRPTGGVLNVSITYKPPADADPRLQLSSGREIETANDVEEEDEVDGGVEKTDSAGNVIRRKKKVGKGAKVTARASLSTKEQDFQLRIKIIEGRQLAGSNISPVCRIKCADQTRQCRVQKSTNAPFWNEMFFLNFLKSPADLFDQSILFEVLNSQKLRSDSLIGSFKCDVGTIYDEPQHAFLFKWLLLSDPEDEVSGVRGFLKICITLVGPGDDPPSFISPRGEVDDDIESNILRPAGVLLRPATFKLKIFQAEDLPRMDSSVMQSVKQAFGSDDKKELVDPFFVFGFAGRELKSKKKKVPTATLR